MYRHHPVDCPNPNCQKLINRVQELELNHRVLKNLKSILITDLFAKTSISILLLSIMCWILALIGAWISYRDGIIGTIILSISWGVGIKYLTEIVGSISYHKLRTELLKDRLFSMQRKTMLKDWEEN